MDGVLVAVGTVCWPPFGNMAHGFSENRVIRKVRRLGGENRA